MMTVLTAGTILRSLRKRKLQLILRSDGIAQTVLRSDGIAVTVLRSDGILQ